MWTEEREAQLLAEVGDARPVSQSVAAAAAEALEVSTRSVSAKLRKMGVEVEKAGPRARKFSDEQEAALVEFLSNNEGAYTSGSKGLFANATYSVTDDLRINAGIRRAEDDKGQRDPLDWANACWSCYPPTIPVLEGQGETNVWKDTLWKAGIE